ARSRLIVKGFSGRDAPVLARREYRSLAVPLLRGHKRLACGPHAGRDHKRAACGHDPEGTAMSEHHPEPNPPSAPAAPRYSIPTDPPTNPVREPDTQHFAPGKDSSPSLPTIPGYEIQNE